MTFEISVYDKISGLGTLRAAKVIYSDGFYELMGYCEAQLGPFESDADLIAEVKESLMNIFCKLQNAEIRIFRKRGVDVAGKLNWKLFNHR